MTIQAILALLGMIVVVGGITSVVMRRNSATIINSIGSVFTGSLRVAMGRG